MSEYIKRQKAVNLLKSNGWYSASDSIAVIPSADVVERKRGEWILCSERLPKDGKHVLVSVSHDGRCHAKYEIYFREVIIGYIDNGVWKESADSLIERYGESFVTAWMPLPNPYDKDKGITCGDCDWYIAEKEDCIEGRYVNPTADTVACDLFEAKEQ